MKQARFKKVPFDLELAEKITNGEVKGRIVTRDGRQVRIICFDKDGEQSAYPIVALIQIEPHDERMFTFSKKGVYSIGLESSNDLHLVIPTYHKDYSNFVPQKNQPCLVRDVDDRIWIVVVCAGKNTNGDAVFYGNGCLKYTWRNILPLSKVTERLIGTTKSYEQLCEELDAESTATNQEPDAESTSIIPDVEFEDDKQFDFHEIKTFADACEKLGMKEHLLTGSIGGDREAQGQAQALYKLLIIQKAINNGKWRDKDGWSYYPYWVLYSKEEMELMSEEEKQKKGIRRLLSCASAAIAENAGVSCANAYYRGANTKYCFPLCFNSEEAALYAAKQFEYLFFQYYGIKVKS